MAENKDSVPGHDSILDKGTLDAMDAAMSEASAETPAEPEIAPEQAATTEPAPEADTTADTGGDLSAALREVREEKRQLKEQLEQEKRRIQAIEAHLQQHAAPQQEDPLGPEPALPDVNEVGLEEYLQAQAARDAWREKRYELDRQVVAEHMAQQQQQVQTGQFLGSLKQHDDAFRAKHPDYDDAVLHLARERAADLVYGEAVSPAQAEVIVKRELAIMANHLMAQGKSPADYVYAMAQRRGFQGAQQTAQEPISVQPTAKRASAAARAEAALGGATGAPASGNNLHAILDLDDRDKFSRDVNVVDMLRRAVA